MTKPTPENNLFPHRFDVTQAHDALYVQDAFNLTACHAHGVLNSLFFQFEGDGRMSDENIQETIDAVLFMIDDMKAIIRAHFDASKAGKEDAQ
ncbi:hypothetical protein [Methylosarcina fibrata]|uniref:hypothetical protein n=1 Tax=Methylosarcina fibrata TaxID=105972 RepID=UPI00039CEAFA|nr:hypothetical protein [Methylosarcina fibrata]